MTPKETGSVVAKKDYTVIMVTNVYFPVLGGISTYIHSLSQSLTKMGVKVRIVAYPSMLARRDSKGSGMRLLSKIMHVLFIFYSQLVIMRYRLTTRKVIVHSHSANFCLMVSAASKRLNCKAVHTFHSPPHGCDPKIEKAAPKMDLLLFVSEPTKKLYEEQTRAFNKNTALAPGGVNPNRFKPVSNEEKQKHRLAYNKKYGIPVSNPLIIFLGRVIKEKGPDVLVEAMGIISKAQSKYPADCHAVIIGPSSNCDENEFQAGLEKRIYELGLKENITFTGPVRSHEIPELLAMADIFVMPAVWQEPVGLVALEAMSACTPAIVSDVGGLTQLVDDGDDGFIVKPGEPGSLAEKIRALLKDTKKARTMGAKGRKKVIAKHSTRKLALEHIEWYDSFWK